jgi:hypothetical protein
LLFDLFSTEQSAGFKKSLFNPALDFFLPNNQLDSKNINHLKQKAFFYRTISWIQKICKEPETQLFSTEQSAGFKK